MNRRDFLLQVGAAFAGTVSGCGGASTRGGGSATAADGSTTPWARGGTAAMTGKAGYPNPFASGANGACALTGALTDGPCYDSQSQLLQDISYGQLGLPMRMAFKVLDGSCTPLRGAVVDVWHVSPTGKYSGNDPIHENVAFCTANDPEYVSHLYFRGKQTTNDDGIAVFDTCFPGWYPGRTVHVHLTVTIGTGAFTSQLVFDDGLVDDIVGTQPIYNARGHRSTTNATDGVVSASTYKQFLFDTERLPDGALLAWKTIVMQT